MATRRRTGSNSLLPFCGARVPSDDPSNMPVPSKALPTRQDVGFAAGEEPVVRRRPPGHRNLAQLRQVLSIDDVIRGVLFLLAVLTRFYRLGYPNKVVFDEYHFGKFTEAALTGHFKFDIHPWLGKHTIALFAYLGGYRPGFAYSSIGATYPDTSYLAARFPAGLFGSMCVPLMYSLCREFGVAMPSAFLGAWFCLLDNMLLIESRLILTDAQLVFYMMLTLLLALKMWRCSQGQARRRRYFVHLIGTAVAGAAAVSIKWTAGVTPVLVAVVCASGIVFLRRPLPWSHCALAGLVALVVYSIPWYVQLKIATISTPSAHKFSERFRRAQLSGNESVPFDPESDMTFLEKFIELHRAQFVANKRLKTRHNWESRWYVWPLNRRSVLYFVERPTENTTAMINLIQNPVMSFIVLVTVVSTATILPVLWYKTRIRAKYAHETAQGTKICVFLLCGYVLNLLPYVFVKRCSFLYHYLPSSFYGQLLTAFVIDKLPRAFRFRVILFCILLVAVAFVYWAPWVYCFPLSIPAHARRVLLKWM